jgi:hypothetical protein
MLDSRKKNLPCTEQTASSAAKIPLKAIFLKIKSILLRPQLEVSFLTPGLRWASLWAIPWALEHQNITLVDETPERIFSEVRTIQYFITLIYFHYWQK